MEGPGFLTVAVQPGDNTDLDAFHDWYNTEHGPLRLRLPFIETGDRYSEVDGEKADWWAVYDVSDLSWLSKRMYSRLREERSAREKRVMGTFESLDRKIYSSVSSRGDYRGPAPVTFAKSVRIHETDFDDLSEYLEDEHINMLAKVPGWLRTRRFKMVAGGIQGMPPHGQIEHLAVHDFSSTASFATQEFQAANTTPWTEQIRKKIVWSESRKWKHHLTFDALEEPPSTVITTDGAHLRFQLEGNPDDPVIVCVNSIMTSLHIWDDVTRALISGLNGQTYRVLRYNSRGYSQQNPDSNPTSFDLLADDIEYLLQRVRVDRVHAVLGVSMGGVTALNFAIRHPTLLDRFVACDCNVMSSAANSQAWAERVELARTRGMDALAGVTVERWFTPANHGSANARKTRAMVAAAHLEGFRLNSLALSDYDLRPRLSEIRVPGLLVAGEGDGKIPEAMQRFGIDDTTFNAVPGAGHLPFLENHEAFVAALGGFLSRTVENGYR